MRSIPAGLSRWGLVLLPMLSGPAFAQEFYALGGAQYTHSLNETSYSFSYEYLHNLSEHFAGTFTWLNEGHVTDHHRDGLSPQLWARWLSERRTFVLGVGIGPYRYYDTTHGSPGVHGVTDEHDWGVLYSVAAQWYFRYPWVLQLRYNRAETPTSIDTDTLQIGIGYQFDLTTRPGPGVPPATYTFARDERNEITLMAGNSIQNNFQSPHGVAWGAEYRHSVTAFIDLSAAYLDEGDTHVVKRHGVAGEAWLTREFLARRASIGLGGGLYLARDEDLRGQRTEALGLLSMSAAWRFGERIATRLYWYRTLTTNGRDTDVVMLGLGYAF